MLICVYNLQGVFDGFVARSRAHLAAERSEEERSGAKWRGRGLGQRNMELQKFSIQYHLIIIPFQV